MKKNFFVLLSLSLIISFVSFGQGKQKRVDETEMKPDDLFEVNGKISLIKLIANPEKYDGKRIQVIGYLHLEFEGNAIYLHEEDFKKSIIENSFWVNFSNNLTKKLSLKNFNDKYVIIIGTFKAKEKGHMGLFGGTIDDIVRLDNWNFDR